MSDTTVDPELELNKAYLYPIKILIDYDHHAHVFFLEEV